MLFKAPVLKAIAEGEVDLAFRRWRRPTVRAGGTLTTPVGVLAIEAIEVVEASAVTDVEAVRAGYSDAEDLRRQVSGELPLHRIAFRLAGEDPRRAMRADTDAASLDAVEARLARLDARGPWTDAVLALIAENPGVRAPDLAARLGRETAPFKADVRKLKALGLTESLEVGYRLSQRGDVLRRRRLQAGAPGANPRP